MAVHIEDPKAFLSDLAQKDGSNTNAAWDRLARIDKDSLGRLLTASAEGSVVPPEELLKNILEKVSNDDEDGLDKKLFVLRHVVHLLQRDAVSSTRVAGNLLTHLQFQLDLFPTESLFELLEFFLDRIKSADVSSDESIELLPKILRVLSSKNKDDSSKSSDYRSIFVARLTDLMWRPQSVVRLVALCKDLDLEEAEEKRLLKKVLTSLDDLDLKDLPPVVYQSMLLSAKRGHQRFVLDGLAEFFQRQSRVFAGDKDGDSIEMEVSNGRQSQSLAMEVKRTQGTVLLHISTAMRHSRQLSQEVWKYLKNLASVNPKKILQLFNMALAFALAKIPSHEDNVFKLLKDCVLGNFKDAIVTNHSGWLRELFLSSDRSSVHPLEDVSSRLESVVDSVTTGWEHALEGLVKFSLILMEIGASKIAPGKTGGTAETEHSPLIPLSLSEKSTGGKAKPEQLCSSLGGKMLVSLFKRHEEARAEIVDQLLTRVALYAHVPGAAFVYSEALARVANASPFSLIESSNRIRVQECVDQLPSFAPALSKNVLSALMPVFKLSHVARDYLLLVLRKCLFNRKSEARKAAVHGYLLLLRNFRCAGSSDLSSSQLSQTYQFSQVADVETRFAGPTESDGNKALCVELMQSLKRTFGHQADVKALVLECLPVIVKRNSELKEVVFELLLNQLVIYLDRSALDDDFGGPPLLLHKCVQIMSNSSVVVIEPLGNLIRCCTGAIKVASNEETDCESQSSMVDVQELLNLLCKRLAKCDLDDFEMDKTTEISLTTNGLKNVLKLNILLGALESLLEFKTLNTTSQDVKLIEGILRFYVSIQEFLKDGFKSGKKEKDDDGATPSSSANAPLASAPQKISSSLSLDCLSQLLKKVCLDDSSDDVAISNLLRSNHSLVRHLFQVSLQKIAQLSEKGFCEGAFNLTVAQLFHCLCDVCLAAWGHFFNPISVSDATAQQNEANETKSVKKGGQPLKLLMLDIISAVLNLVKDRFSASHWEELVQVLHAEAMRKDDDLASFDSRSALFDLSKTVRREVARVLRKKERREKWSELAMLLNLLGLFHSTVKPGEESYEKIFDWLMEFAQGEQMDDPNVVKILFSIIFNSKTDLDEKMMLVAVDARSHFGELEEETMDDDNDEKELNFQSISIRTAASVVAIVLDQVGKVLDDVSFVAAKLRAASIEAKETNRDEEGPDEALEEKMKKWRERSCDRLNLVQKILGELCFSKMPFGSSILKDLLKQIIKFYVTAATVSKVYLLGCQGKVGTDVARSVDEKFRRFLEKLTKKLSHNVHPFIFYLETAGTTEAKKRSEKLLQLKTANRDSLQIPQLIFAMEQFDGIVLQLAKKTKLDLSVSTKNVARDFRITADKVQEAMTLEEKEEGKENEENVKRKGKKTAKKMAKRPRIETESGAGVARMITSTQRDESRRKTSIGASNEVSTICDD